MLYSLACAVESFARGLSGVRLPVGNWLSAIGPCNHRNNCWASGKHRVLQGEVVMQMTAVAILRVHRGTTAPCTEDRRSRHLDLRITCRVSPMVVKQRCTRNSESNSGCTAACKARARAEAGARLWVGRQSARTFHIRRGGRIQERQGAVRGREPSCPRSPVCESDNRHSISVVTCMYRRLTRHAQSPVGGRRTDCLSHAGIQE